MDGTATSNDHQQMHSISANGSTIQYVTEGNPEQAAVAVLQAVFGTTAPLISNGTINMSHNTSPSQPISANSMLLSNSPSVGDVSAQTGGNSYFYESLLSNGIAPNSTLAPSPTSPQAALTLASTSAMSMTQSSLPTQIVAQSGNTFLVQSNNIDAESAPITHTTRASPITVAAIVSFHFPSKLINLCCDSGSVAVGQLRDSRRSQLAQMRPVLSLLEALQRERAGTGQCCFLRQTHPIRFPRPQNPTSWHPWQLKVPLLWHQNQTGISTKQRAPRFSLPTHTQYFSRGYQQPKLKQSEFQQNGCECQQQTDSVNVFLNYFSILS